MDAETRYETLCEGLLAQNGDLVRAKMMGMPSLKLNGKLVAGFVPAEGAAVFKLTDAAMRENALAIDSANLFEPMSGRQMKEWVVVPASQAGRWPELANAAIAN